MSMQFALNYCMVVIKRILMKKKKKCLHYPIEKSGEECLSEMEKLQNKKPKNGVRKKKGWEALS